MPTLPLTARFVPALFSIAALIGVLVSPAGAHAAQDTGPLPVTTADLTVENPQDAWFPSALVRVRFSGCAARSGTRLELRRSLADGVPVAVYPSPTVNVGGVVRASLRLPAEVRAGTHQVVLLCTSPDGQAVSATASLTVAVAELAVPAAEPAAPVYDDATAAPANSVPAAPATAPTAAPAELARTGLNTSVVLGGAAAALVCGLAMLVVSRRRRGPRWLPAGTPLSGPR